MVVQAVLPEEEEVLLPIRLPEEILLVEEVLPAEMAQLQHRSPRASTPDAHPGRLSKLSSKKRNKHKNSHANKHEDLNGIPNCGFG